MLGGALCFHACPFDFCLTIKFLKRRGRVIIFFDAYISKAIGQKRGKNLHACMRLQLQTNNHVLVLINLPFSDRLTESTILAKVIIQNARTF